MGPRPPRGRGPGRGRVLTTRAQLAAAVDAVVAADPAFAAVVAASPPVRLGTKGNGLDRFGALARSIVYQQLAGRAAAAIHARFVALFEGGPTPEALLEL